MLMLTCLIQARRQDFAAGGGQKPQGEATFLNTIFYVRSNRRAKHEMGGTDFK